MEHTIIKKRGVLEAIKAGTIERNNEMPFYVADLADIVNKFRVWRAKLPRVEPFYAVKCNPDPLTLRLMVSLGIGFDCASKWEMDAVLSAGAKPSDIIYAHPYKSRDFLRHAAVEGVDLMTFDSETELQKIKDIYPSARLVIRFRVPDVIAEFPLNDKFGCHLSECSRLLKTAQKLGLEVVGTSFHVGSLCKEPDAYSRAISMSRQVFNIAEELGFKFTLLDLGGGYPGHNGSYELFNKMCYEINEALDEYFPIEDNVRIIAEPGCYFVCSAFTLCTTIIGKREIESDGENDDKKVKVMYFLNDGNYTSFGEGIEKYNFRVRPFLSYSNIRRRPMLKSKLWGWSCCSTDCIMESCVLPLMDIGEHIIFENMGAYTICLSSNFNGLPKPTVEYTYSSKMYPDSSKVPYDISLTLSTLTNEKISTEQQNGMPCEDDSNSDICRNG